MAPRLALLLTVLFVAYLFVRDFRQNPNASRALWIPWLWMMNLGSRSVSSWLDLSNPLLIQSSTIEEGSPADRLFFLTLIVAASIVLSRRRISWTSIFRNNLWLTLFFLYCGISVIWSDFPFIALKRWFKSIGEVLVVLVLLTDREPLKAVETVLKRTAYVLIPVSILFIKYYGDLGRSYDPWTGEAFFTGITTNKNTLGIVCLVGGLFFLCTLLAQWRQRSTKAAKKSDLFVTALFLFMIAWLFGIADSKTPLITFLFASLIITALQFAHIRRHIGSYLVVGALLFSVLQLSLNVTDIVIESAGRDTTLTGRTDIWKFVLEMGTNPLIGTGFESFWLGERLQAAWAIFDFRPTQAHNGYLEIYLNLGFIGLFLLSGLILSGYLSLRRRLTASPGQERTEMAIFDFAAFGMGYLVSCLIYNVTEAGFRGLGLPFVIFVIVVLEYPRPLAGVVRLREEYPKKFQGYRLAGQPFSRAKSISR
jgi:O-antigen ligase